ncbi:MAG: hypothetical protein LBI77_00610 [Puniceicoccales bacterium]|jgi:hypothetical protein|nr:hypothetical protein [Puniceicoccales bacterium]
MKQPREGILEHFQDHIYAILRSKNDFLTLHIASHKRSNFDAFCGQLIGESFGEGLFIGSPLPRKLIENVPGPVYEQVDFSVQIIENIVTNQSGRSALLIAEKVAALLHLLQMNFAGRLWTISCRTKDPWAFEGDDYRNIIALYFTTMCSF